MSKTRMTMALAALAIAASDAALAQPTDYRAPWRGDFWGYIGASGGESKFRTECDRTLTLLACDHKDTGWKVYAGGKMNDLLGLEVGYTDFGRIQASGGQTKAWAVPITLVAGAPIGRFNVFGKVGGVYGRTDVDVAPSSIFDRGRKNGWGWTYGAGGGFNITRAVQLRADWDRYKLDFVGGRKDVDMLSGGLAIRF